VAVEEDDKKALFPGYWASSPSPGRGEGMEEAGGEDEEDEEEEEEEEDFVSPPGTDEVVAAMVLI